MSSRHGAWVSGLVAVLVVLAACSSGSAMHRPPRGVTGCNHMISMGDAGTGVGLDWDTDRHPYGITSFVHVCDGAAVDVAVDAPAHVSVQPPRVSVNTAALLQFRLVVDRGARGALHFTFLYPSGDKFGDVRGPEIVAEGDSWHFARS